MSTIRPRKIPGPKPDPHPEIPAAGSVGHVDSLHNSTKDCFDWGHHHPYAKRSLLDPIQHLPGKIAPNVLAVSEKARPLTHGVRCDRTHTAEQVLSRPQKNPLLMDREAEREKIYHRKEHQVLGRSIVTDVTLPDFTKKEEFRFGMKTKKEEGISSIINPAPKDQDPSPTTTKWYPFSNRKLQLGERRMYYGPDWEVPLHGDNGIVNRLNGDGQRVRESLRWDDNGQQDLNTKLVNSRLADFRERTRPELGKVHDPMKSTMAHLPESHVFGITVPPHEYTVCELLGYSSPVSSADTAKSFLGKSPLDKTKLPAAGLQTHHYDDLDQEKHIIPKLNALEDKSLPLKITEDVVGGKHPELSMTGAAGVNGILEAKKRFLKRFDLNHTFGVPSVRDPSGRIGQKKLTDATSYSDELGAKGLVYPTPRNVYGLQQLREFERRINEAKQFKVAAA